MAPRMAAHSAGYITTKWVGWKVGWMANCWDERVVSIMIVSRDSLMIVRMSLQRVGLLAVRWFGWMVRWVADCWTKRMVVEGVGSRTG